MSEVTARENGTGILEFQCRRFRQGEQELYVFVCSGKELWSIVEVNRRVEDKDEGYQRALSPGRVKTIARFVDDGNSLPGSVLISFEEGEYLEGEELLRIPQKPDAGWVLDGQHRLAGIHNAHDDTQIPVVAFLGLEVSQQIQFFVTVNKEQKGVPSSLYYDLLKSLPPTKSEKELLQERAADLAMRLKLDETSPFFGRIVTVTAPKQGELSTTNVVRKLYPKMKGDSGCLFSFDDDTRRKILNNFYRGIERVFPSEFRRQDSIFFKTLGFGALMNVFPYILHLALSNFRGQFRVEEVERILRVVEDFDFDVWRQMGTGTAAEATAGDEFRQELTHRWSQSDQGTGIKLD